MALHSADRGYGNVILDCRSDGRGYSKMQCLRLISSLLLLALLSAGLAFSQAVNGSLVGTITDASGAVVPNANVSMTETNTGVSRSTATGEAGNYVFANVPPGTYTV